MGRVGRRSEGVDVCVQEVYFRRNGVTCRRRWRETFEVLSQGAQRADTEVLVSRPDRESARGVSPLFVRLSVTLV